MVIPPVLGVTGGVFKTLASYELSVVSPTCNAKPTGRALSNVRLNRLPP